MQNDCFLIDWLSFRCVSMDWSTMAEYLGLLHCQWQSGNGFYGYRFRKWCTGISIHYENDNVDGVLVEMSGTGCRAFETFAQPNWDVKDGKDVVTNASDWISIIDDILYDDDFKITRLDIAFDDKSGCIPMKRLVHDVASEKFVSRFKSPKGITLELHPGLVSPTIYFGSPQSEIRFRIYDKASQLGFTDGSHWIRFEVIFRRDMAYNFLEQLVKMDMDVGKLFSSVVQNYFRIVSRPKDKSDKDKRRWPTAPYWSKLLEDAMPVSLWVSKDLEYNKHACESYVYGQAGNSVYALIELDGLEKFREQLLRRKSKKIPQRITNMIATERALAEQNGDAILEELKCE